MSARDDIGPALPPRATVYWQASQLVELGQLARELATQGPKLDLGRAVKTLDRARELLGGEISDG